MAIPVDLNHPLLHFIAGMRCEDAPSEVREVATLCILDTLSAMAAGLGSDSARIAADYAGARWRQGDSTILFTGQRRTAVAAAFANAVAANATDLDDVGRYTWGHPGAIVVPTALALTEERGLSGADLVSAVIVGYETAFRSGRCLNYGVGGPAINASREYRACGAWGAAASAAITAHIQRHDPEQIAHALGVAEYHAPDAPMLRDMAAPSMLKHAIGVGALTGVMAADLAARGFTGIPNRMLWSEHDAWTRDAGQAFILPRGVSWKKYSCCSYAHAALDAVRALRDEHGEVWRRLRRIRVRAFSDAAKLGARAPSSSEEAQFSMAWSVAVMFMDGEVHPRSMSAERLKDQATQELAARVELVEDEQLTQRFLLSEAELPGGEEASVIEVELDDGSVLEARGVTVLFPEQLPSRDEVEAKFRWACADVLTPMQIDAVLQLSRRLLKLPDVRELVAQLTPSAR